MCAPHTCNWDHLETCLKYKFWSLLLDLLTQKLWRWGLTILFQHLFQVILIYVKRHENHYSGRGRVRALYKPSGIASFGLIDELAVR